MAALLLLLQLAALLSPGTSGKLTGVPCPAQCACPKEAQSCPPGISLVTDSCGCCKVCARQYNQDCALNQPCDHIKGLHCDYGADPASPVGICRAKSEGRPCEFFGQIYQNGENFQPNCKHQCTCMDGVVGCMPLCPQEMALPGPDCINPRLVKVPGQCCEAWQCDSNHIPEDSGDTTAGDREDPIRSSEEIGEQADMEPVSSNELISLVRNGFRVENGLAPWPHPGRATCAIQTTDWSHCSKSCDMGVSSRITNDNPQCKLMKETRLCQIRPCRDPFPTKLKVRTAPRGFAPYCIVSGVIVMGMRVRRQLWVCGYGASYGYVGTVPVMGMRVRCQLWVCGYGASYGYVGTVPVMGMRVRCQLWVCGYGASYGYVGTAPVMGMWVRCQLWVCGYGASYGYVGTAPVMGMWVRCQLWVCGYGASYGYVGTAPVMGMWVRCQLWVCGYGASYGYAGYGASYGYVGTAPVMGMRVRRQNMGMWVRRQLWVCGYGASYRYAGTAPVMGMRVRRQLWVCGYGASYRYAGTAPVMGMRVRRQLWVCGYGASYGYVGTVPVMGMRVRCQLWVCGYGASYGYAGTVPVMGMRVRRQLWVCGYGASYGYVGTAPVIGMWVRRQL
uniref:Cellular communication network factor 1 like n=1 Tax=Xenopus tropicalis TaxID=8364 RepID=F7BF33_XENTR